MVITLNYQVDVLVFHRLVWYELDGIRAVAATTTAFYALSAHLVDGAFQHVPVEWLVYIPAITCQGDGCRDEAHRTLRTVTATDTPILIFCWFFGGNSHGVGSGSVA